MKFSEQIGNIIKQAKANLKQPPETGGHEPMEPVDPAQPPAPAEVPATEEELGNEEDISPFSEKGRVAAARASLKRLREQ